MPKYEKVQAAFIDPMPLLRKEKLSEADEWLYETKLDGYRAIAFKRGGRFQLRSRNDNESVCVTEASFDSKR